METVTVAGLAGVPLAVYILIYGLRQVGLADRFVPLTAVILGVALALAGNAVWAQQEVYQAIMYGIATGGAAVGIHENSKHAIRAVARRGMR